MNQNPSPVHRILLTAYRFFPYFYGGGELYIHSLAKGLQEKGHRVRVLTMAPWKGGDEKQAVEEYTYEGIDVTAFGFNPTLLTEGERYSGTSEHHRLIISEVIRAEAPDVIHANGLYLPTLSMAREYGIPVILTVHNSGFACPAGTLIRPDMSICSYAAGPNVCVPCCSMHRAPHWYSGGTIGKVPPALYRWVGKTVDGYRNIPFVMRAVRYPWLIEQELFQEREVWKMARVIVAPSVAIQELLLRNGVEEKKIVIIPHGSTSFVRTAIENIQNRPIRLGFVGQIGLHKGIHLILEALEKVRNGERCEFHIFGDGQMDDDKSFLRTALSTYRGTAKIVPHGYVKHNNLQDAYSTIDVLLVPSLAYEAFGLVVTEALSAGRPAIVSKSGALPELIDNGKTGFIIERNNSIALAEKIQLLIDDPEKIIEMSRHIGTVKTLSQYTDEISVLYEALYKKRNKIKI